MAPIDGKATGHSWLDIERSRNLRFNEPSVDQTTVGNSHRAGLSMIVKAMATNAGRSIAKLDSTGRRDDSDPRYAQIRPAALMATILVLGLAYAPNFYLLASVWRVDPNYSHGWLVFPIALVILWQRLTAADSERLPSAISRPWLGWCFLATILAVRAFAYERSYQWLETATILPAIACLVWSFGSWPLLRRAWPAIAFLVFMLPLPDAINNGIALPLQQIATSGSAFLLQLSGLWAIQEGNVINLRTAHQEMGRLDVATACNGLRMLMTLSATVTATIILIPLPTWKRIVLMISIVPIALISNIARIVVTGFCYYWMTGPTSKAWAHDVSGWVMMPMALLLVGLELAILSWLVPTEDESDEDDGRSMLMLLSEKTRKIAPPKGRHLEV
jgi:exosortase